MILFKNADVYAPKHLGRRDVLVCGGRIEAVGETLEGGTGCRIIDASGKKLAPGLIDRHVHVTGGGGEGSFHTRTPSSCPDPAFIHYKSRYYCRGRAFGDRRHEPYH